MKSPQSLALLLLGLFLGSLSAQDYENIAPKAVPTPDKPPAALPSVPPPPVTPGATQELLPKLRGLVFVPSPQAVDKSGSNATGVVLKNVTVPAETDFRALVSPYVGKRFTQGDLSKLTTSIILFYRQHDHPLIDVIVPEQDIADGAVQLILLEGKMGKVSVTGNNWAPARAMTDGISVKQGEPVLASQLLADLDWINQNPFHSSELVFRPGQQLGQTDLVLETKDRFPARFYVGYEDNGNAQTGFDRYEAGVNWGDAFWLGLNQQLNYQYTTSGDGASLRGHSGNYVIPLPWRHTLTFFGSYVTTKGQVPPLIGLDGFSYQISSRYTIPLPTFTPIKEIKYTQSVGLGFDHKYNENSLEFGTIPVPGSLYNVNQFVLAYNGTFTDPYGQTTVDNEFYYSPGNWGPNNNDAAYSMAHFGATANYVYDSITLQRLTKLPFNWTLLLRSTVQKSNANLVPSEQLGFGGYGTIRGYDDREVNTDEGFMFTTELRTPSFSFGETFGFPQFQDQLQILGFWDYGSASNHTPLAGESTQTPLSSVGCGLRYNIGNYATLRFDYGFQLLSTGLDNDHGSRGDIGVVISY